MNTHDRIPLVTRLLRPGYAREVAFLAAEHRRSGVDPLPADRRGELELACEAGRSAVAERRVTRRARRLRRIVASGERSVQRARSRMASVAGAGVRCVRLEGQAMTVAEVRDRTRATAKAVEADQGARRLDRSGRLLHVVGVGLLLVDATALVVIFGFLLNIDWSRPDPANLVTVLALSIFGAAVQAVLAVHLGRRLWAWRHTDRTEDGIAVREFPPRSAVIVLGGALLLALSALAAGALYLRVQREGVIAEAGDLAGVLGVLLGASALAAPWCLVADEAYGPGPDARLLSAGGLILARSDRRQRRQARGARRSLATATRRLRHAEWLLAATVHAIGRDHLAVQRRLLAARGLAWGTTTLSAAHLLPSSGVAAGTGARAVLPILIAGDHRCLTGPIERLRDALASAEGEFLGVVDRVDPDELDLAG